MDSVITLSNGVENVYSELFKNILGTSNKKHLGVGQQLEKSNNW